MHFGRMACLGLIFAPVFGRAEILKFVNPTPKGLHMYWYPAVASPVGWHQDKAMSEQYKVNAFAPKGSGFNDAVAVIYAKACYKPKVEEKSLTAFIESDKAQFEHNFPGVKAMEAGKVSNASGKQFRCVQFLPSKGGNWERVAYLEEGEFYVVFTLSSRTKAAYEKADGAFSKLLASYKS